MPGPDPHAIWIESDEPLRVCYQAYFWTGNLGNRRARSIAILRRLVLRTWQCKRCGEALPVYLRADAVYCSERCRKRAARMRRGARKRL